MSGLLRFEIRSWRMVGRPALLVATRDQNDTGKKGYPTQPQSGLEIAPAHYGWGGRGGGGVGWRSSSRRWASLCNSAAAVRRASEL